MPGGQNGSSSQVLEKSGDPGLLPNSPVDWFGSLKGFHLSLRKEIYKAICVFFLFFFFFESIKPFKATAIW